MSILLDGIQSRIAEVAGERVAVTVDSVPSSVLDKPDLEQFELLRYRKEYANQHFDLIFALGPPAISFADKLRKELWPGIPLVFTGLVQAMYDRQPRLSAPSTGILLEYDWLGNTRLAKRLFPNVRHIALAGGGSTLDVLLRAPLEGVVREQKPAIEFINLSGYTFEQQVALVSKLPPDTVLILGNSIADVAGHPSTPGPHGFRGLILQSANCPVLQIDVMSYSVGGLGGSLMDYEEVGREAADSALSVLNGTTPPDAPPSHLRLFRTRLNWPELQRWKVPESLVPPEAIVDSRRPSLWREHRDAVLLTVGAIVVQTLLILFLLYERKKRLRAQEELAERLRFEALLSQVAASFANQSGIDLDRAMLVCLQQVKDFFGADRASIWALDEASNQLMRSYVWPDAGTGVQSATLSAQYHKTIRQISQGGIVRFSNALEMAKMEDADAFRRERIQSFLAIPLQENNRVVGVFSIANYSKDTQWPEKLLLRLRVVTDVLGTAMARDTAEKELQKSELMKESILTSIRSSVAVVDCSGVIIDVNKKWNDFAVENGQPDLTRIGIGANYLDVCRTASVEDDELQRVFDGVRSVLNGSAEIFEMEYPCLTPKEQKWFRMSVDRLHRPEGGAVISHLDVTERKNAELDRTRAMEEITHMNRVISMGHMTASLAHELAQPLAAILSNAQAGVRYGAQSQPNIAEISRIFLDISEDDKRASAVLQNIRSIMKKAAISPHDVDLNRLVESVAGIVRNDALSRGARLRIQLAPEHISVKGDEVPLQQVIINLIINGMDAMRKLPEAERIVTVSTGRLTDTNIAFVTVGDAGPGITEEIKSRLFTPFFTTKSDGLGMGLSICRTLMESLGGSVALESRLGPGASFRMEMKMANP